MSWQELLINPPNPAQLISLKNFFTSSLRAGRGSSGRATRETEYSSKMKERLTFGSGEEHFTMKRAKRWTKREETRGCGFCGEARGS